MRRFVVRELTSLLAVLLPIALPAQSPRATAIHGRVVQATSGAPIASATVDVANVRTGAAAGRVTSTADGTFRVPGLPLGQYRVTVRALGFAPRSLPAIALTTAHPDVDLGVVTLTEIPLQLQTQAVTA